jgi:hypothetical protein
MLAPSFQDFCFISAFTVHSPPDVDNEQINQGQQHSTAQPVPELGKKRWVFVEDPPPISVMVDKVFEVSHGYSPRFSGGPRDRQGLWTMARTAWAT